MSTYIEVCTKSIRDASERLTPMGKLLKSVFLRGPSDSVKSSKGKVTVTETDDFKSDDEDENKEGQNDNSNEQGEGQSSQKESYHYSIYEAYSLMYERGRNKKLQKKILNTIKNNKQVNNSTTQSKETPDKKEPSDNKQPEDNKETEQPNENTQEASHFEEGPHLFINVFLKNEGYTKWEVVVDNRASGKKSEIIDDIESYKFDEAYKKASEGLESDGLVPIKVSTYMNEKQPQHCPFVGHCRWAFDAGSENKEEDSQSLNLVVAPLNAKTNKPDEKLLFTATYNIVGDITGGVLGQLFAATKDIAKDTTSHFLGTDRDNYGDSDATDKISKFLHQKFKCTGNSITYYNFFKVRDFIDKQIKAKNLEYDPNKDVSDSVMTYKNNIKSSNTFIYY